MGQSSLSGTRPLFLDTNLVVLLAVGFREPLAVPSHRRTSSYTRDDFFRLHEICERAPRLVTLGHVLAEASTLLKKNDLELAILRSFIDAWDEIPCPSRQAAATPEYSYLGLADAAILQSVARSCLVLSDDGLLVDAILRRGGEAWEFRRLRDWDE